MAYEFNYFFPNDATESTPTSPPYKVKTEIVGWMVRPDKNTSLEFALTDRNGNIGYSNDKSLVLTKEGRAKIKTSLYELTVNSTTDPTQNTIDESTEHILESEQRTNVIVIPEDKMKSDAMAVVITVDGTYDGNETDNIIKSILHIYSNKAKLESAIFEVDDESQSTLESESLVKITTVLETGMPYVKPIQAKIYASKTTENACLIKTVTIADQASTKHTFSIFESDGIEPNTAYYYWAHIYSPFGTAEQNPPKQVTDSSGTVKPIIMVKPVDETSIGTDIHLWARSFLVDGPEGIQKKETKMDYIRLDNSGNTQKSHKIIDTPTDKELTAIVECDVFRGGAWDASKDESYSIKFVAHWLPTKTSYSEEVWSTAGTNMQPITISIDTNNNEIKLLTTADEYTNNSSALWEDVFSKITVVENTA